MAGGRRAQQIAVEPRAGLDQVAERQARAEARAGRQRRRTGRRGRSGRLRGRGALPARRSVIASWVSRAVAPTPPTLLMMLTTLAASGGRIVVLSRAVRRGSGRARLRDRRRRAAAGRRRARRPGSATGRTPAAARNAAAISGVSVAAASFWKRLIDDGLVAIDLDHRGRGGGEVGRIDPVGLGEQARASAGSPRPARRPVRAASPCGAAQIECTDSSRRWRPPAACRLVGVDYRHGDSAFSIGHRPGRRPRASARRESRACGRVAPKIIVVSGLEEAIRPLDQPDGHQRRHIGTVRIARIAEPDIAIFDLDVESLIGPDTSPAFGSTMASNASHRSRSRRRRRCSGAGAAAVGAYCRSRTRPVTTLRCGTGSPADTPPCDREAVSP